MRGYGQGPPLYFDRVNPSLTGLSANAQVPSYERSSVLLARLGQVRARIGAAERAAGRPAGSVRLLAVSKTFPASDLLVLGGAGQRAFGESYLDEALSKINAVAPAPAYEWHYIGRLQRRKLGAIARAFQWVHALENLAQAERLGPARDPRDGPLDVCIQVNVDADPAKAGVAPDAAAPLAHAVARISGLRLRGLMTVPARPVGADPGASFARLGALFDALRAEGLALDTLSMGMSADLEAAIAHGATLVRIGTAIFGTRDTPQ